MLKLSEKEQTILEVLDVWSENPSANIFIYNSMDEHLLLSNSSTVLELNTTPLFSSAPIKDLADITEAFFSTKNTVFSAIITESDVIKADYQHGYIALQEGYLLTEDLLQAMAILDVHALLLQVQSDGRCVSSLTETNERSVFTLTKEPEKIIVHPYETIKELYTYQDLPVPTYPISNAKVHEQIGVPTEFLDNLYSLYHKERDELIQQIYNKWQSESVEPIRVKNENNFLYIGNKFGFFKLEPTDFFADIFDSYRGKELSTYQSDIIRTITINYADMNSDVYLTKDGYSFLTELLAQSFSLLHTRTLNFTVDSRNTAYAKNDTNEAVFFYNVENRQSAVC
jgi:hypothetical protein